MLIRNGVGLSGNPMSVSGSTTNFYGITRSLWTRPGAMRGFDAGPATVVSGASISATAGRPNGYEAPHAWLLARRGGGLAAYTSIEHPNVFEADLSLGINLDSTMTADGSVTTAELSLVVALACTMVSSCATSADVQALAQMASTMLANGDLSGALSALAFLATTLAADTAVSATMRGTMSMDAVMSTQGSVDAPPTPSEIAVAVWEYALAGTSAGLRLGEVSAWRMALLNQLDTTSPTSAATQMVLARKILNNRLEVEIASQSLVLYDDNGYTVLQRWPLTTTGGEAVTTGTGVQTKRGMPT